MELGDVGLFIKKKFVDQAVFPVEIAGAGGVRFPAGPNDEKFTDDSHIKVVRPDVAGTGAPPDSTSQHSLAAVSVGGGAESRHAVSI
ncbi:MAG: hypothetical protein ACI9HK_004849 [Pirellulaceae bacterium]|jgi:hypothetical protein